MALVNPFLLWVCLGVLAAGLHIDVVVHYPEEGSAVEHCGFQFRVATSFSDPAASTVAARSEKDTFVAKVELPDSRLYEKAVVGVLADVTGDDSDKACQALCPRMGSQGQAMQSGAFVETRPLALDNRIDIWPAFCKPDWGETRLSFQSEAIGRRVDIVARVPAASLENNLSRPSNMLPPIMFRFNSEWYWPESANHYDTWHDMMDDGYMEFLAIAEVYIDGVGWREWDTQPIFTDEKLSYSCQSCDPELQFVCDSWESSAYFVYRGGNHSFGSAAQFFDELYSHAMPQLLRELPPRSDNDTLRVGAWGYCIGALAAWNALTLRPDLFNMAYLGSPAMDFNCGDPFRAIESLNWGAVRPRIYIDSGAAEGQIMNRMTLRLFRMLQEKGLVEGRDIFYSRAEFGTHQASAFLRRALKGLLILFGSGTPGLSVYTPAMHQVPIIVQPDNMSMGGQWFAGLMTFFLYHAWSFVAGAATASAAFLFSRANPKWSLGTSGTGWMPLLPHSDREQLRSST